MFLIQGFPIFIQYGFSIAALVFLVRLWRVEQTLGLGLLALAAALGLVGPYILQFLGRSSGPGILAVAQYFGAGLAVLAALGWRDLYLRSKQAKSANGA